MRGGKIFLCVALIFFAATTSGCKDLGTALASCVFKTAVITGVEIVTDVGEAVAEGNSSAHKQWIKDVDNGAYVWNYRPYKFDGVRLVGDVLREGENLYAHGYCKLFWFKEGQLVETHEGHFKRGEPYGKFKVTAPNGESLFTYWSCGAEIPFELIEEADNEIP